MKVRTNIIPWIVGLALTGCALEVSAPPPADSPSASPVGSPAFTPQAMCERDGGRWHADKNLCEHQSPGRE